MSTLSPSNSVVKTRVYFDKSAGEWVAENGDVLGRFPGDTWRSKQKALLIALQHDRPEMFALVERIAQELASDDRAQQALMYRAVKAVQLLLRDHVRALAPEELAVNPNTVARVKSQSNERDIYTVWFTGHPAMYLCNCQDAINAAKRYAGQETKRPGAPMTPLGPMCKHALAAHLAWLLDWPVKF